ncbi:hypothetical protein Hanom_Chr09g00777621 [Helianthus anomalus]
MEALTTKLNFLQSRKQSENNIAYKKKHVIGWFLERQNTESSKAGASSSY